MGDLPVLLRIIRGEEDPEETPAAEAAEPAAAPSASLVTSEGDRMSWQAQARAAVAHAFRLARHRASELAARDGGLVRAAYEGKPQSVAEVHEYAKSRAWVPPGHDGGIAEYGGVLYYAIIGRLGVAVSNLSGWVFARAFRFFTALFITSAIALIALLAFLA